MPLGIPSTSQAHDTNRFSHHPAYVASFCVLISWFSVAAPKLQPTETDWLHLDKFAPEIPFRQTGRLAKHCENFVSIRVYLLFTVCKVSHQPAAFRVQLVLLISPATTMWKICSDWQLVSLFSRRLHPPSPAQTYPKNQKPTETRHNFPPIKLNFPGDWISSSWKAIYFRPDSAIEGKISRKVWWKFEKLSILNQRSACVPRIKNNRRRRCSREEMACFIIASRCFNIYSLILRHHHHHQTTRDGPELCGRKQQFDTSCPPRSFRSFGRGKEGVVNNGGNLFYTVNQSPESMHMARQQSLCGSFGQELEKEKQKR